MTALSVGAINKNMKITLIAFYHMYTFADNLMIDYYHLFLFKSKTKNQEDKQMKEKTKT